MCDVRMFHQLDVGAYFNWDGRDYKKIEGGGLFYYNTPLAVSVKDHMLTANLEWERVLWKKGQDGIWHYHKPQVKEDQLPECETMGPRDLLISDLRYLLIRPTDEVSDVALERVVDGIWDMVQDRLSREKDNV